MSERLATERKSLQLELPAEAASLALIRAAVAAEAAELGMDRRAVGDLKAAVSEACANVVLHAYEQSRPGPIELELRGVGKGVLAIVRDFGAGFGPIDAIDSPRLCLGLPMIGALSWRFALTSARGAGTEVRIQMPLAAAG